MTKAYVQKKYKGKGEDTKNIVEFINIITPPNNPTFNILIKQLRDARKEVSCLKGERLIERRKMSEVMDMYNETLYLYRFIARRFLPLHRQLKTLYRKNRSIQSQNKKLKEELHPFKDDLAQRNLNVLEQAVVERSALAKERNDAATEGSYPATRRSARLRR